MIRKHGKFPAPAELALVASGLITSGLVLGMLGFDGLVTPDNRLMMPSGVLALLALAWIMNDRVDSLPSRLRLVVPLLVVVWTVVAVRPQDVGERFSDNSGPRRAASLALRSGASVVVTNDADALHWDTGLSTVYPPQEFMPLTGERVNEVAIYNDLPCALLRNDGVVILTEEAFLVVNRDLLQAQVDAGNLTFEPTTGADLYRPTDRACD
jgi:hypothetical protein